jgi:hypothetical protein
MILAPVSMIHLVEPKNLTRQATYELLSSMKRKWQIQLKVSTLMRMASRYIPANLRKKAGPISLKISRSSAVLRETATRPWHLLLSLPHLSGTLPSPRMLYTRASLWTPKCKNKSDIIVLLRLEGSSTAASSFRSGVLIWRTPRLRLQLKLLKRKMISSESNGWKRKCRWKI